MLRIEAARPKRHTLPFPLGRTLASIALIVAFPAQSVRGQVWNGGQIAEWSFGVGLGTARDNHGLSGALGEASVGIGAKSARTRAGVSGSVFRTVSLSAGNCSSWRGDGVPVLVEEACAVTGASLLGEGNVSGDRGRAGPVFYLGGRLGFMSFRNRGGLAWDAHVGADVGQRKALRIEIRHKEFGTVGFRSTAVVVSLARTL